MDKWILNIYIRYIIVPVSKYFFKLKYGNIIVKKVSDGRLTDTILYIMAFNDPSWYSNKSHKNMAPSNWYYTPRLNAFPHITIVVYPSILLRGNFEELMARRGVPLEEIMVYEALRLKSFHAVGTANVSPIQLAAAGFYATDGGREVRCFSCGIRHGMHATQRHKTGCRHKNGLPCGNVTFRESPLPSEWSIISTRPRYPPITTDIDLHSPVSQPQLSDPRPTADTNHRVTDHTTEPDRLASFELASTERHQAPHQTPKAEGMYVHNDYLAVMHL